MKAPLPGDGSLVRASRSSLAPTGPAGGPLVPGPALVSAGICPQPSRASSLALAVCGGALLFFQSFVHLPVALVLTAPVIFWGPMALGYLRARRLRRRLERSLDTAPALAAGAGARGERVRVVGEVKKGAALIETPAGDPVVLVRYLGCRGSDRGPGWASRWYWEIHGLDFCVEVADGHEVWVDTRAVLLLPHPPPTSNEPLARRRALYLQATGEPGGPVSWIYDEEAVRPGDRVEVAGVLDQEPHPSASVGSDRQPRMRSVLRGTPRDPVQVRRLAL